MTDQSKPTTDMLELYHKVAKAIAGVRWDKIEEPNGNTQSRSDYCHFLAPKWMDEAKAAADAIRADLVPEAPVVSSEDAKQALNGFNVTLKKVYDCSDAYTKKDCSGYEVILEPDEVETIRTLLTAAAKESENAV